MIVCMHAWNLTSQDFITPDSSQEIMRGESVRILLFYYNTYYLAHELLSLLLGVQIADLK